MKRILILNGPNLNLLGTRDVNTYGNISFGEYLVHLHKKYTNVVIEYVQSNLEGEIINILQQGDAKYDGVILNAAAYTHTSIAISDTVAAIKTPVVEVHISCILGREDFRRKSLIAPYCKGTIMGFGLLSYDLGIESFLIED